jgi:hypothetical protein
MRLIAAICAAAVLWIVPQRLGVESMEAHLAELHSQGKSIRSSVRLTVTWRRCR